MWIGSWLLEGCGGETGVVAPPPEPAVPECVAPLEITVTEGLAPTFSWEGDCAIGRLVVQVQDEDERWSTETVGLDIYESPIEFGVHPEGATEPEDPIPLEPGITYTVNVFTWVSVVPESLLLVGTTTFTP